MEHTCEQSAKGDRHSRYRRYGDTRHRDGHPYECIGRDVQLLDVLEHDP